MEVEPVWIEVEELNTSISGEGSLPFRIDLAGDEEFGTVVIEGRPFRLEWLIPLIRRRLFCFPGINGFLA